MANDNWWKYGLAIGGGIALGAVAATVLTRNPEELKKTVATLLAQGMNLKEKAATFMETMKENMEDFAAEARDINENNTEEEASS